MIRLIERLWECGSAPAVDLMEYGRGLESFGGASVPRPVMKELLRPKCSEPLRVCAEP